MITLHRKVIFYWNSESAEIKKFRQFFLIWDIFLEIFFYLGGGRGGRGATTSVRRS